jgi:hypothetical protein
VLMNRVVVSGHTQIGIGVNGQLAAAEVNISNSEITNNGLGIGNLGGTTTIRLWNNDISFNATAFSGATSSHINNRVQGNNNLGTTPSVIGVPTNFTGTQ